jgi:predicted transcriptional regulator
VLVEEVQEKFGWSKKTVLRRASQLAEFGMIELQEDVLTTGENR